MTNTIKYAAMLLDAPMQSWGYQSRFDQRTTLSYPTKSGVTGLLCAAMGIQRSDRKSIARLAEMHLAIYTLVKHNNFLQRIIDFHTVGGGYAYPQEKQHISPKADGSKGTTVVTRREFLLDAKFAVIFQGEGNLLQQIGRALENPVWGIWCGRKSCIPASPVFQGIYDNADDALEQIMKKTETIVVRKIFEVNRFEDGTDFLMDIPVDFQNRKFLIRRISDSPV